MRPKTCSEKDSGGGVEANVQSNGWKPVLFSFVTTENSRSTESREGLCIHSFCLLTVQCLNFNWRLKLRKCCFKM